MTKDGARFLRRGTIALLAVGVFINYVDRGNLATAAPLIKDQLHLSNTQAGVLLSAFFWTYVPFQLIAGWLAERIGPYRTLAMGVALWSVATFASGLAGGFFGLLLLRLLLGIGESATYPCNAKILASNLPPEKLGAANGTLGIGQALGPAVGTFGGGLLIAGFGWRPVFLLFGLASALWLIPWLRTTRTTAAWDRPTQTMPTLRAILARREVWGAGLGHFAFNYGFYFVITWLPLYLVKARGFTITEMSIVGGLLYLIYAVSVQASGLIADARVAKGADNSRVRRTLMNLAHVGMAACMLLCAIAPPILSLGALLAAGLFFGMGTATLYPIGQTLGGPIAAGRWIGVQNCIGNIAGIVAPIITGRLVDASGGFGWAFAIAAAVSLAGTLAWRLIPRIEALDWA